MLIELSEDIQKYYVRVGENISASEVALLQLEHTYYKHDSVATAVIRLTCLRRSMANSQTFIQHVRGLVSARRGLDPMPRKINSIRRHFLACLL